MNFIRALFFIALSMGAAVRGMDDLVVLPVLQPDEDNANIYQGHVYFFRLGHDVTSETECRGHFLSAQYDVSQNSFTFEGERSTWNAKPEKKFSSMHEMAEFLKKEYKAPYSASCNVKTEAMSGYQSHFVDLKGTTSFSEDSMRAIQNPMSAYLDDYNLVLMRDRNAFQDYILDFSDPKHVKMTNNGTGFSYTMKKKMYDALPPVLAAHMVYAQECAYDLFDAPGILEQNGPTFTVMRGALKLPVGTATVKEKENTNTMSIDLILTPDYVQKIWSIDKQVAEKYRWYVEIEGVEKNNSISFEIKSVSSGGCSVSINQKIELDSEGRSENPFIKLMCLLQDPEFKTSEDKLVNAEVSEHIVKQIAIQLACERKLRKNHESDGSGKNGTRLSTRWSLNSPVKVMLVVAGAAAVVTAFALWCRSSKEDGAKAEDQDNN